jgi:cytochrome c biogenesis protein CcmG/thiol:disulfide interchange protein DsbE
MTGKVRTYVPLAVFLVIGVFLGIGLTIDSTRVPSPFVDRPLPAFELPTVVDPKQNVRPADFRGQVWLLNVWATWCAACREEHEVLMRAAREYDLTIVGLDYKDKRDAALDWFDRLGNPYVVSAFDADGRAAIDLGVYGVPETYVIDRQGIVRRKHIGPISPDQLRDTILPLVRRLETERPAPEAGA